VIDSFVYSAVDMTQKAKKLLPQGNGVTLTLADVRQQFGDPWPSAGRSAKHKYQAPQESVAMLMHFSNDTSTKYLFETNLVSQDWFTNGQASASNITLTPGHMQEQFYAAPRVPFVPGPKESPINIIAIAGGEGYISPSSEVQQQAYEYLYEAADSNEKFLVSQIKLRGMPREPDQLRAQEVVTIWYTKGNSTALQFISGPYGSYLKF